MAKRILLVDDESAILFAYKKVLQKDQVIVDAVESKEETLKLLEKQDYNVAILDLRLGGESCEEGFELISVIREKYPQTTIIMITAYGNPEIKDRAYKLGADYYFEKPVSTRVIQGALKKSGISIPDDKISNVEWKFQ
ncbi:MAG TPA: response regulator [archaeon]|nr:response regulator [archaeon]